MYNYIKGTLAYASDNTVVVEAGGVGYELCASSATIAALGRIGDECKIYCYLSVKEDEMRLYGFADAAEKQLFCKLIDVSGIGCKMAIAILSSGDLGTIIRAITSADVSALSKIKGVGKKTAERLVVELRDKLGGDVGAVDPVFAAATISMQGNEEIIEGLMSLGFTRQEALVAVARNVKPGMTTEEAMFAALKG